MNTTKPATARRLKQCEDNGTPIVPITRPLEFDVETEEEYLYNMEKRHGRDPEE
jgi:sulfite oxidase